MAAHVLAHLGELLERKNRTIRREAVEVFATYAVTEPRVVQVLCAHLESLSWDARVSASDALAVVLRHSVARQTAPVSAAPIDSSGESNPTAASRLASLDIGELIRTHRPLLSAGASEFATGKGAKLSSRQQRTIIDQHLDLSANLGLTSAMFLSDAEVLPSSSTDDSNMEENGNELHSDMIAQSEGGASDKSSESSAPEIATQRAIVDLLLLQLSKIADVRWQIRHGAALAISKIFANAANWLSNRLVEEVALRLLQVLSLDRFNDFVSGRSATAPVCETVALAVAHIINHTKRVAGGEEGAEKAEKEGIEERRQSVTEEGHKILDAILVHLKTLLDMESEKVWVCRQSALLVMKYYFAIAEHSPIFETFFDAVVQRMEDDVDDVVSSSVTALASLFSNTTIASERKKEYVARVMQRMWMLLHTESQKEQVKAGMDSLVVDLLAIMEVSLREDTEVCLTSDQLHTVLRTIDPTFRTRSHKAVRIIGLAADRKEFPMDSEEIFGLLKVFYRVLLFAPPTETMPMLEEVYLTSLRVLATQREKAQHSGSLRASIGLWLGCLMHDNKSASIDVFAHNVDGDRSKRGEPIERIGSEEIRFLSDRDKDAVYVARKILAAKFLAALIQLLFEANITIGDQKISTALQLLFLPFLRSSSLYQNLGAAIVLNEWAALWKAAVARNPSLEVPGTAISFADSYVRAPTARVFDEMASTCATLTADCNEFVEWCLAKGANSSDMNGRQSAEEISRHAYESCVKRLANDEEATASLTKRYALLCDVIDFTKLAVKANSARIYAFFSSALFNFGFLGDKLTPLIRPLVEIMNGETNETVAAEVFRGSVPLLIAFSAQRSPKPYVKVLTRTVDAFASCKTRIPRPENSTSTTRILSLEVILNAATASTSNDSTGAANTEKLTKASKRNTVDDEEPSPPPTAQANGSEQQRVIRNDQATASRNALLLLTICTGFSVEQLPEFYGYFDLDAEMDNNELLTRFELHHALWQRVGSRLSEKATSRISTLLASEQPELRHAAAKAVETFIASHPADAVNRLYAVIARMLANLDAPHERRGAIEALLRLSLLPPSPTLCDVVVPLLAPLAFARFGDQLPEVREAAGVAFRHFLPILTVHKECTNGVQRDGLSEELSQLASENRTFVSVLSSPSSLTTINKETLIGLADDVSLRNYQLEGVTWMSYLRRFSFNGILADDMGLGKTLQMMCAIVLANQSALAKGGKQRPSLVICPRTLVDHWCAEWRRYFPDKRKSVSKCEVSGVLAMERAELVVASYDEMKSNEIVTRVWWRYVVLDEGHILRNPRTAIFRATCALRSENRLILSGTPVQNSSADLWALFTFLIPGFLGDERTFRASYIKPIQQSRSPKATETQMKEGQEALGRLHRLVLPFVLRRLKTDVLRELPDKSIADYECTLSELQKTIYEMIVDRCCASATGQRALSPLHALISLRKVVDHPCLVADLANELGVTPELRQALSSNDIAHSGKLQALGQILAECGILRGGAGSEDDEEFKEAKESKADEESVSDLLSSAATHPHRALIFCQWRLSVALVAEALQTGFASSSSSRKTSGKPISFMVLDGSVPTDSRQRIVDKFNNDTSIDVLVLTTHIGGVGLNLTGADVVIFLDHDWNPMKDIQAIDRAHRLGQTRNVMVYRLITKGTIEEKVMSYQKFKRNTADALIGSENRSLSSMKTDELLSMFALEEKEKSGGGGGGNPPAAKKARKERKAPAPGTSGFGDDEVWNLSEIWDESQYDEAFSISAFLKEAGGSSR